MRPSCGRRARLFTRSLFDDRLCPALNETRAEIIADRFAALRRSNVCAARARARALVLSIPHVADVDIANTCMH